MVSMQAVHIINAVKGSHNRVEAAVCLYARMVDKDNLWMVLYALKVTDSLVAVFAACLLPVGAAWLVLLPFANTTGVILALMVGSAL